MQMKLSKYNFAKRVVLKIYIFEIPYHLLDSGGHL